VVVNRLLDDEGERDSLDSGICCVAGVPPNGSVLFDDSGEGGGAPAEVRSSEETG